MKKAKTKVVKSVLGADPLPEQLPWIGADSVEKSVQKTVRKSDSLSNAGLPEGWTRQTFIVRDEHHDRLKHMAYWDRRRIKDLVEEALSAYIKKWKPPVDHKET